MKPLFVFDMGGVVVQNFMCWPLIAEKLGLSGISGSAAQTYAGFMKALERGTISSTDFLLLAANREHIPVPAEDYWKTLFAPVLNPDTVDLIRKLRQAGYRVVCGTNTIDVHYAYHEKNNQYAMFDAVYASHLMGQIKPDAAFWQLILDKENSLASGEKRTFNDMVFFDDFKENIAAAAGLGIQAYLFTTAEQAAADIRTGTGIQV